MTVVFKSEETEANFPKSSNKKDLIIWKCSVQTTCKDIGNEHFQACMISRKILSLSAWRSYMRINSVTRGDKTTALKLIENT